MEIVNVLMKRRSEFNRLRGFVDSDFKKLVDMSPDQSTSEQPIHKDQSVQAGQEMSEHEARQVTVKLNRTGFDASLWLSQSAYPRKSCQNSGFQKPFIGLLYSLVPEKDILKRQFPNKRPDFDSYYFKTIFS